MNSNIDHVFRDLGLAVLERGWLSSNNIVFRGEPGVPATVVDTGYGAHSTQTEELIRSTLAGRELERILNTHLHSDHCGGNASLQAVWGCEVWVPEASFDTVGRWDESELTYHATGQQCQRFTAQRPLRPADQVRLGSADWEVIAAPGHDPDSVMLFQRDSGVLISADALWGNRLAIIFPELDGKSGFREARGVLDTIELLQPKVVIPGHGGPFTDVARALQNSRDRITYFEANPDKHLNHAARALTMFHMLEHRVCERSELKRWLVETPIFQTSANRTRGQGEMDAEQRAEYLLQRLINDGLLQIDQMQIISAV